MKKIVTLLLVLLCCVSLSSCKEDTARERKLKLENKEYKKELRNKAPVLKIGVIHWKENMSAADEKKLRADLHEQITRLIRMVDEKDFSQLPEHISHDRGLWVDLKAHRKYSELLTEIKKENGYLQKFYFNSDALRKHTGDMESLAVRDVLRHTDTLSAEVFIEASQKEVEVKLTLEDYPEMNYHLNPAVFILEGDRWLVYRLF